MNYLVVQQNPVAKASYNGWDHHANHMIPPFWLDDCPSLLWHVGVRPAAGCSVQMVGLGSSRAVAPWIYFRINLSRYGFDVIDYVSDLKLKGSSTESYPSFAHIGLKKPQPGNLPRLGIEPGHLVSVPDVLTVTLQLGVRMGCYMYNERYSAFVARLDHSAVPLDRVKIGAPAARVSL
ncbi:hypothetical protein ANN_24922 [Periplaneta americana]|uniref:Uncharacterized protein n=1 Tax=Periplaneta americana TaxID=6978 RepID=A0ABQ8RZY4_PERAM|nr:hypothetical protein ANN_24922 [Periplaneta americana]